MLLHIMNNKILLEILDEYIIRSELNYDLEYDNAFDRIQHSQENSICFYKLYPTKDSLSQFFKHCPAQMEKRLLITTQEIKNYQHNIIVVLEKDFLQVQKIILDHMIPIDPSQFLLVGITGTNGKTSVAHFVQSMINQIGVETITMGTLGVLKSGKKLSDYGLTTPSYIELRKILYRYYGEVKVFIMELSSHALDQNRLYDLKLDIAAWTSFGQDHLDYHKNLEEYFKAKLKILKFLKKGEKLIISQRASELVGRLQENPLVEKVMEYDDDFYRDADIVFQVEYNRLNLEIAYKIVEKVASEMGLSFEKSKSFPTAPTGRMTTFVHRNRYLIVDYAHTPCAVKSLCESVRKVVPNKKVAIVFGCGGNRDKGKRILMVQAAQQECDYLILTSDNPRDEPVNEIISDMKKGLSPQTNYKVEEDRKKAIVMALEDPTCDVVLVVGKGHEDYQEIAGIRYPLSDTETIKEWMKKNED